MYRCTGCGHLTESKEEGNCPDTCKGFSPRPISIIHHRYKKGTLFKVLCTDKPMRDGTIAITSKFGITCLKCKQKLIDNADKTDTLVELDPGAIIPELNQ